MSTTARKGSLYLFCITLFLVAGCSKEATFPKEELEKDDFLSCLPTPQKISLSEDPLAGSTVDDGLTETERYRFIRKNLNSTVKIYAVKSSESREYEYYGTGVAIRPDLIITAAHVIEGCRHFWANRLALERDNLTIAQTELVRLHLITKTELHGDVALLRLDGVERIDRPIEIKLNRQMEKGDLLWQFGNTTHWSRGRIMDASNPNKIKIKFRVAEGDSGAPVVWPDGSLAGIILSLDTSNKLDEQSSSVGYFMPVDEIFKRTACSFIGL